MHRKQPTLHFLAVRYLSNRCSKYIYLSLFAYNNIRTLDSRQQNRTYYAASRTARTTQPAEPHVLRSQQNRTYYAASRTARTTQPAEPHVLRSQQNRTYYAASRTARTTQPAEPHVLRSQQNRTYYAASRTERTSTHHVKKRQITIAGMYDR